MLLNVQPGIRNCMAGHRRAGRARCSDRADAPGTPRPRAARAIRWSAEAHRWRAAARGNDAFGCEVALAQDFVHGRAVYSRSCLTPRVAPCAKVEVAGVRSGRCGLGGSPHELNIATVRRPLRAEAFCFHARRSASVVYVLFICHRIAPAGACNERITRSRVVVHRATTRKFLW